jgi:hypothetical protein
MRPRESGVGAHAGQVPGGHVPQVDAAVGVAGGQYPAVRAERHRVEARGVGVGKPGHETPSGHAGGLASGGSGGLASRGMAQGNGGDSHRGQDGQACQQDDAATPRGRLSGADVRAWPACRGVCGRRPLPGRGCPALGAGLTELDHRCPALRARQPQPGFGLIEEGVNLLLVVARPPAGGRELLVPDLTCCQRGFPEPEEGVTDGFEEGVNLLLGVARPHPGGRKSWTRRRSPAREAELSRAGRLRPALHALHPQPPILRALGQVRDSMLDPRPFRQRWRSAAGHPRPGSLNTARNSAGSAPADPVLPAAGRSGTGRFGRWVPDERTPLRGAPVAR